jgi:prevent-host-death family protein
MGRMIGAAEFKAKCLAILDEVQATGEPVTVTKRGKPVAVITQAKDVAPAKSLFGIANGTVTIHGDLDEPIDSNWEQVWEAKWGRRGFTARHDDAAE